ncbi:hypothetical protein D9R12_09970 [Pseudoxanthomonas spadix]|nr:hypothetical protein D9R12_09970 [Pseudoxanthomonas spadix]
MAVEPAPGELVAILEALKRAGALRAELEIIQGWAWRRLPGSARPLSAPSKRPLFAPSLLRSKGEGRGGVAFVLPAQSQSTSNPSPALPCCAREGPSSGRGAGAW